MHGFRKIATGIGLAALLFQPGGCATARGGSAGQELPEGPVRVEVASNSTFDVVVYAVYGGQRYRLGDVTALGTATFRVPPALEGGAPRVRFLVDAIGSPVGFQSDEFTLRPGDTVVMRVQPNLRQTTVSVR